MLGAVCAVGRVTVTRTRVAPAFSGSSVQRRSCEVTGRALTQLRAGSLL